MKKQILYLILFMLLIVGLTFPKITVADPDDNVVSVDPATVTANPGETFTINITIANVTDLNAWEIKLKWSISVLGFSFPPINITEGPFLSDVGTTQMYVTPIQMLETVQIGVLLTENETASGNGTLVTIDFPVVDAGNCTLDLYDVKLFDNFGNPITPVTEQDGYFYTTKPFAGFTISNEEDLYSESTAVTAGTEVTSHINSHASDDVWYQINSTAADPENQTISVNMTFSTTLDPATIGELFVNSEAHIENATLGSVEVRIYNYAKAKWENCFSVENEEDAIYSAYVATHPKVGDYVNATGELKLQVYFFENTTGVVQSIYLDETYIVFYKLWTYTFDASASYDPDGGSITDYSWDFGDGNTNTGMIVNHTYTAYRSDAYIVNLTVTDDEADTWFHTEELKIWRDVVLADIWPTDGPPTEYWEEVITEAEVGFVFDIIVTAVNDGTLSETFNVTLYIDLNTTVIGDEFTDVIEITIPAGAGSGWGLIYLWNTTDWELGNYTVTAVADTVAGETETDNNILDIDVEIIPEFPIVIMLPLFMFLALIAVALTKKNQCKVTAKTT